MNIDREAVPFHWKRIAEMSCEFYHHHHHQPQSVTDAHQHRWQAATTTCHSCWWLRIVTFLNRISRKSLSDLSIPNHALSCCAYLVIHRSVMRVRRCHPGPVRFLYGTWGISETVHGPQLWSISFSKTNYSRTVLKLSAWAHLIRMEMQW